MSTSHAILFGPLPPPYGGVSVFMDSIKDACLDRGVEVWSYTGDGGDPRLTNVSHRLFGHLWSIVFGAAGVRVTDSTHFHLEHPHWLLLPLWLLAKRHKNFTWVKICHDATLPSRYEKMSATETRRFERAVNAIDELIVYSDDLKNWFREIGYEGELRFMPFLTPLEPEWAATPASVVLGDFSHDKLVSSIGVFLPFYGFDKLTIAIENLRNKHDLDIGLVLLDGGFARDAQYRASVVRDRSWIRVIEELPHPEIGSVIAASDVFVRPVEYESYGRSRAEAIMTGVPVIATNVGETRGVLTYDFADVAALEKRLENVLLEKIDVDISRWRDIYVAEAKTNLDAYIQLITGDANA